MEITLSRYEFSITSDFEDIEFDEEQQQLLNEPSNLTKVLLISDYWGGRAMDLRKRKTRLLDFTGTTNEQAIKKILAFYKHKSFRRGVGDHTFFEGFTFTEDGKAYVSLGS